MNEFPLFETKHWRVILRDDDQTYLGRSVVVSKEPCPSLSDLAYEQWIDLVNVIRQFEGACRVTFGAKLFNWSCLMNLAYQNDPPDPLVHWHVRPRYSKPVTFAGETFTDEEFGKHYARGTDRQVKPEVARQIVAAIQKELTV